MLKKSKFINISFACSPNKGSENQLGYIYSISTNNELKITLCPLFEFNDIPAEVHKISNIYYKKIDKSIYIKLGNIKKPKYERTLFQIWLFYFFFVYLAKLKKRKIHFVTYNQILTINPFHFVFKEKAMFGPLGGQTILYKYNFLSYKKRIVNFIVNYLYKICTYNFIKNNKQNFFCHPDLAKKFNSNIFYPIINLGDLKIHQLNSSYNEFLKKRKKIVFIGKNIEIKLPKIVEQVFLNLSKKHKEYNFEMIGQGFKNLKISNNFYLKSKIDRAEILKLYENSYLHVFISLELGGFVSAESALKFCPNFISKGYGADLIFKNNDIFAIKINEKTNYKKLVYILSEKIDFLINNPKLVYDESIRQNKIINNQNLDNLQRFLKQF